MMSLFPSRAQWSSWSLPSKLTAIGAYAGILGIPLALGLFALSVWSQDREASQAQLAPANVADSRPLVPEPLNATASGEESSASHLEPNAIALDDLLASINRKDLTYLQREQMRERLAGRRVTWRVCVRQVMRLYSSHVLVLFIPITQQSEHFPDVLTATFPAADEVSLSALRPDDVAVIEGSLAFSQHGLSEWLPGLEDAELLSYSTPSK